MENAIPPQEQGNQLDVAEKVAFKSSEQACEFYEEVKERLLDVNRWAKISDLPSASFQLCDSTGAEVHRNVKLGDYFKINIPAPGIVTGEGFDWVKVELIHEEQVNGTDIMSMRVRPAPNPNTPEPEVAHFFSDKSTSTFQIRRVGKEVFAEVHGRNEEPNTKTGNLLDNARNSVVGLGATMGLSVPQWKGLVSGLVKIY
jgi:hypothetical protein